MTPSRPPDGVRENLTIETLRRRPLPCPGREERDRLLALLGKAPKRRPAPRTAWNGRAA